YNRPVLELLFERPLLDVHVPQREIRRGLKQKQMSLRRNRLVFRIVKQCRERSGQWSEIPLFKIRAGFLGQVPRRGLRDRLGRPKAAISISRDKHTRDQHDCRERRPDAKRPAIAGSAGRRLHAWFFHNYSFKDEFEECTQRRLARYPLSPKPSKAASAIDHSIHEVCDSEGGGAGAVSPPASLTSFRTFVRQQARRP